MKYNYCGNSGLLLPEISLGLWHNFGDVDNINVSTDIILRAFDKGITHFDLANNYGPPPGSAESNFGKILSSRLRNHRDSMIISSKAGHLMWDGPYGDGGSRKYIMASIDQSLRRTGLEYFDIFYSHRYDPNTPIEETMGALADIVKQGKALYIGISKYPPKEAMQAYTILQNLGVRCLIYQDKYNLLHRKPELEHTALNEKFGVGFIAFSPLAQGMLTDKYLHGIPKGSRAEKSSGFLKASEITPEIISKVEKLNQLAQQRGQSLAEMSLAWLLFNKHTTSVLIGASSVEQLEQNIKATDYTSFSDEEHVFINSLCNQF